jgi:hypothetical protein
LRQDLLLFRLGQLLSGQRRAHVRQYLSVKRSSSTSMPPLAPHDTR